MTRDLTGNRYGKLLVVKKYGNYYDRNGKNKDSLWQCQCDCGNQIVVRKSSLTSGCTRSCGCLRKYNEYDLSGEYGIGYTSRGTPFYFDLEDYELIKNYCWIDRNGDVCSKVGDRVIDMHRVILNMAGREKVVDHKNGNGFDNRRNNIRIVTQSQNHMNNSIQSNNTSGVTGVVWQKRLDKWRAQIQINGKLISLGYFKNFDDAVAARKAAEEQYFGEYSYDNSRKDA